MLSEEEQQELKRQDSEEQEKQEGLETDDPFSSSTPQSTWQGPSAHGRVVFGRDEIGRVVGRHTPDEKKRRKDHLWDPITKQPETPKISYGRSVQTYVESDDDGEGSSKTRRGSISGSNTARSSPRRRSKKRQSTSRTSMAEGLVGTSPPSSPGKWWHVSDRRIEQVVEWLAERQQSPETSRRVPQFSPKWSRYGPMEVMGNHGFDVESLHDSSAETGEAEEEPAPLGLPRNSTLRGNSTLAWTATTASVQSEGGHGNRRKSHKYSAWSLRPRPSLSISYTTAQYTAGPSRPRWSHSLTGDSSTMSRPSTTGSPRASVHTRMSAGRLSQKSIDTTTARRSSVWGSILNWASEKPLPRPKLRGTVVNLARLNRTVAIPSVHRGTRHGAAPDELIDLYIDFMDVKGRITLSVHPELHIGPDRPPTEEEEKELDRTQPSVGGYTGKRKKWLPQWTISLKGLLKEATGVEVEHQFLTFGGERLMLDSRTLQDHGITHGCTILGREKRPKDFSGLKLATTLRKTEVLDKQKRQISRVQERYLGYEASKQHGVEAKMRIMPVWVSQAQPRLFAKLGEGINKQGGQVPYVCFEESDIYRPFHDLGDPTLQRIRSSPAFTRPIKYEAAPA